LRETRIDVGLPRRTPSRNRLPRWPPLSSFPPNQNNVEYIFQPWPIESILLERSSSAAISRRNSVSSRMERRERWGRSSSPSSSFSSSSFLARRWDRVCDLRMASSGAYGGEDGQVRQGQFFPASTSSREKMVKLTSASFLRLLPLLRSSTSPS